MKRGYSLFGWTLQAALACLLLLGISGPACAQIYRTPLPGYTLTDLSASAPNYGWSFAYAISNTGQAVGDFVNLNGESHAFRTQPNAAINYYYSTDDLGVLSGDFRSYGFAVNNSGIVVGDSVQVGGFTRAIRSTAPGAPLDNLNTVSGSHTYVLNGAVTHARGISDNGWIVGFYSTSTDPSRNDPYSSHSFVTFGPGWTQPIDSWYGNPAYSATYDVNNRDQVVGFIRRTAYDPPKAFLFDAAANAWRLIPIGTLPGGRDSRAFSVNDSGQVVGMSQISTWASYGQHAFLFQDANNNGAVDAGEMRDLDTMNTSESAALSINNAGTAVGYFGAPDVVYGNSRATIWVNGTMQDLNNLVQGGTGGWTLREARGINDTGQIVGYMQNNTGLRHAFRLDPPPIRIRLW